MAGLAQHRLGILGAAVLFSTGGAAIKACALTGWQVAGFRTGVAALTLALLVPAARRGWTAKTLLVGLSFAATMVLFALGNKLTTAANTIFLQSTAPLYVLVLSPFVLGERARPRDLAFMAVIGLGLALFFVDVEPAQRSAPDPFLGNVLGASAGVTWALTLLGLRWLEKPDPEHPDRRTGGGMAAVVAGNGIAFLVCLPFALPVESSTPTDWAVVLYLGIVQIALAYILLTYGVRRVPALETSLLILLEPTLSPLWAWLLQGETPSLLALVGGAVILAASTTRTAVSRAS